MATQHNPKENNAVQRQLEKKNYLKHQTELAGHKSATLQAHWDLFQSSVMRHHASRPLQLQQLSRRLRLVALIFACFVGTQTILQTILQFKMIQMASSPADDDPKDAEFVLWI